jgi:hypothetical protein
MDLERQGFGDPRINGGLPFVRLPDSITGVAATQELIDKSPAAQKLKELRAEGELTRLTFERLEEALKATFDSGSLIVEKAQPRDPLTGRLMSNLPTPSFRGIDDASGASDFMRDAERQHELRMRGLQDETRLLGLTGSAAASLRAEQELLADAYKRNIDLAPDQIEAIRRQAAAYGEQADALARMKLGQDLAFERSQLFRSPGEQQIASRLRNSGLGLDSETAGQMREQQAFIELRDGIKGFASDFKSELLDNGGDIGDALGTAVLNGFSNAMDKQLERIFEQAANAIAGPVCGPAFTIDFEKGTVQ